MYVDKNHAKMEEAAERQRKNRSLLAWVKNRNTILQIVFTVMLCWISIGYCVQVPSSS